MLNGHSKDVRGVAFLPGGQLVSVGSDKTARLWDVRAGTGKVIHKAKGPLYAVAASANGRTVAMAGRHGTPENLVALYDVVAGAVSKSVAWNVEEHVCRWENRTYVSRGPEPVARSIWSLSFSADGRFLAAAGRKLGGGRIPNGGGGCCWKTTTWDSDNFLRETDAYAVRYAPTGDMLAITVRGGVRFYSEPGFTAEPLTIPVKCDWAPAVDFIPSQETAVVAAGSHLYFFAINE